MNLERGGQADPQTYLNAQPYFYPQNDLLSVLDRIRWPAEPTAGDLDPRLDPSKVQRAIHSTFYEETEVNGGISVVTQGGFTTRASTVIKKRTAIFQVSAKLEPSHR